MFSFFLTFREMFFFLRFILLSVCCGTEMCERIRTLYYYYYVVVHATYFIIRLIRLLIQVP